MRALHFVETFSTLSETFIYEYITELERQGVDNHVVTFRRVNEENRPFPKVHVVDRPHRWHPVRLWHRIRLHHDMGATRVSFWPQTRARLRSVIRTVQPEVIHAHFGPAGVMIVPVANELSLPVVCTLYGYDISSLPAESFWRPKLERLWERLDAVTVLSEEMRGKALQLGCPYQKVSVVHLSRDLSQFEYRPPDHPVKDVLFVGRLVAKKAPLDAIRAIQQANEQGADLRLDMVGDGDLREEVEQYVHENGLSETVTLHGRLPNRDVQQRMQNADAFLLPSKTAPNGDREGTPTVLVEAQAVGLPCISTRHAGIPEMIPDENHGLLTTEGDVVALAQSLLDLSSCTVDELQDLAVRGRTKMERDFNLNTEAQKLQATYQSATAAFWA